MIFNGIVRDIKINLNRRKTLSEVGEYDYSGLHRKVAQLKNKPELCQICFKNKPDELHNISGKYRRNLNDWIWICRKCHSHIHRPINYRKYGLTNLDTKKLFIKKLKSYDRKS